MSTATANRRNAGDPSLRRYFSEIDAAPLLEAEEECELAGRIADGDPHARARLVESNLRLVIHLARGYVGRGLDLGDLIEEGNLGLMRAVEGFDGDRGVRFSTYAAPWIKQSMRRALMNECRPVRLPAYLVTLMSKARRAAAELAESLGREPTPDEVGRALRLTAQRSGMVEQATRVRGMAPKGEGPDGEGWTMEGDLVDDRSRPAEESLVDRDEIERALAGLDGLGGREAEVIRMRFGLGPYAPMTLQAVGNIMGMTRERVRQLEKAGLIRIMAAMGGGPDGGSV
jgi:RNA polymerase primary sigma factor